MSVLLEQRERALEEAEGRLARERAAVEEREGSCASARERLREAQAQLSERPQKPEAPEGQGIRTQQWVSERHYQQRLANAVSARLEELRRAEVDLAEARHTELEARQSLLSAKREVEVLEKDREQFEARERRQAERRAEREADELAMARHGQR